MNKDIIVAEDDDVKIIFYFKVFCELLKECISIYGDTTIENAQQLVKDFHPLQLPISTTDDIVFFSHEPVYHWAMLALYGERYWLTHPKCEKFPDNYNDWMENALSRYELNDCYEFINKNNNVTNK